MLMTVDEFVNLVALAFGLGKSLCLISRSFCFRPIFVVLCSFWWVLIVQVDIACATEYRSYQPLIGFSPI